VSVHQDEILDDKEERGRREICGRADLLKHGFAAIFMPNLDVRLEVPVVACTKYGVRWMMRMDVKGVK